MVFLKSNRVTLEPLEEHHLDGDWPSWLNDPEVCRYNSHATFPMTRGECGEYLKKVTGSREEVAFAVHVESKHVGNICLKNIDWINRSAEFAIIIGDKDCWGQGIGKEAGELLMGYGLDVLNLRRIYCGTHEDNQGMIKLAESMDMKCEGRLKDAIWKNCMYSDVLIFGYVAIEVVS